MNKEEKETLFKLINRCNENESDRFLCQDLQTCKLKIDKYPNANSYSTSRTVIGYTFITNQKEVKENLNDQKKRLYKLCLENLSSDYELPAWELIDEHDDGIKIKYSNSKIELLPISPKITFDRCIDTIVKDLNEANHSIFGAVAWLTNPNIIQILVDKAKEGVVIELIIDDNKINRESLDNYSLPFQLYYVKNFKDELENTMHHKFAVIDNKLVVHGTCNWTKKANYNDEDCEEDKNAESIETYVNRFKHLKRKYSCIKKN